MGEVVGVEVGGAQGVDGATGFGESFAGKGAGTAVGLGFGGLGGEDVFGSFELQGDAGKGLSEGVVDVAGEAIAELAALPRENALRSRVLDLLFSWSISIESRQTIVSGSSDRTIRIWQ